MGNFAEDFLEKLSKQKAGYDLWNNIIEDLNAKSAHASRLERENAKLTKLIEEKPSGDNESPTSGEKSARVSLLEEKVYKLQEEITELLRSSSYYVEHRSYSKLSSKASSLVSFTNEPKKGLNHLPAKSLSKLKIRSKSWKRG